MIRNQLRTLARYKFYDHVVILTLMIFFCLAAERPRFPERGLLPFLHERLFLALAPQLAAQRRQSYRTGRVPPFTQRDVSPGSLVVGTFLAASPCFHHKSFYLAIDLRISKNFLAYASGCDATGIHQ